MHHSREREGEKIEKKTTPQQQNTSFIYLQYKNYCLPTTQLFPKSLTSLLSWYISFITLAWLWEILATQLAGTKRYRCFITVDGIPISANAASNSALPRCNATHKSFIIYSHHNFTVLAFCFKSVSVPQCTAFSPPTQKPPRVLAQTHSWYFIRKGWKSRETELICTKICHCHLFFNRTVLPVGTRTLHVWLTNPSSIVLGFSASKLASGRTSIPSWSAQPQKHHFWE